jgi:hydrogenase 3 maturation protease
MQWKRQLQQFLKQANHDDSPPRMAIVGVGQELQGDDGAGVAVVRRLAGLVQPDESLCLIEAGHAPENVLGSIIRFHPSHILFVDAIRADTPPGTIHWLPAGEADSVGGSTHTLSLAMLGNYLRLETGATVYVIGIEPTIIAFGAELSAPVRTAVEACVETLAHYWRSALLACSASSNGGVSVVKT